MINILIDWLTNIDTALRIGGFFFIFILLWIALRVCLELFEIGLSKLLRARHRLFQKQ